MFTEFELGEGNIYNIILKNTIKLYNACTFEHRWPQSSQLYNIIIQVYCLSLQNEQGDCIILSSCCRCRCGRLYVFLLCVLCAQAYLHLVCRVIFVSNTHIEFYFQLVTFANSFLQWPLAVCREASYFVPFYVSRIIYIVFCRGCV